MSFTLNQPVMQMTEMAKYDALGKTFYDIMYFGQ